MRLQGVGELTGVERVELLFSDVSGHGVRVWPSDPDSGALEGAYEDGTAFRVPYPSEADDQDRSDLWYEITIPLRPGP